MKTEVTSRSDQFRASLRPRWTHAFLRFAAPHLRPGDVSLALFIVAGIVAVSRLSAPVPFGGGFEMVAIAKNIADNGAFANPFHIAKTGPTAVSPPLYPFAMAVFFKFLSPGAVFLVVSVANMLVNAIIAALMPRISIVFFGRRAPGIIASVFWIASARLMPSWDVSYTVLGLLLLCLQADTSRASQSLKSHILVAVTVGCTTMLNPSTVLLTAPWILYVAWRRAGEFPRLLSYPCFVFLLVAIMLAPWIIRNRVVLGAYVFRTNLGMTLRASLNDCAQATLMGTIENGCYSTYHPNESVREASDLKTLGEVKYDRQRVRDAREWVAANPRRFAELASQRFRYFWLPPDAGTTVQRWALWLATALSLPGLLLMIIRREKVAAYVLPCLSLYPAMYYLVVSDVRYRYPVLWISLLASGYAVSWVLGWFKQRVEIKPTPEFSLPQGMPGR